VPEPPDDHEKASYGWRSLPPLASALTASALCVVVSQAWIEFRHPVLMIFFWYTAVYAACSAAEPAGELRRARVRL
jgi:hypothetical protein